MFKELLQDTMARINTMPIDWTAYTDWELDRALNEATFNMQAVADIPLDQRAMGYITAWKGEIKAEIARRNNYIIK